MDIEDEMFKRFLRDKEEKLLKRNPDAILPKGESGCNVGCFWLKPDYSALFAAIKPGCTVLDLCIATGRSREGVLLRLLQLGLIENEHVMYNKWGRPDKWYWRHFTYNHKLIIKRGRKREAAFDLTDLATSAGWTKVGSRLVAPESFDFTHPVPLGTGWNKAVKNWRR